MHVRSTVISEPVRPSGFRYGISGKTTDGVGRKHGTKRGEGKIKVMIAALR